MCLPPGAPRAATACSRLAGRRRVQQARRRCSISHGARFQVVHAGGQGPDPDRGHPARGAQHQALAGGPPCWGEPALRARHRTAQGLPWPLPRHAPSPVRPRPWSHRGHPCLPTTPPLGVQRPRPPPHGAAAAQAQRDDARGAAERGAARGGRADAQAADGREARASGARACPWAPCAQEAASERTAACFAAHQPPSRSTPSRHRPSPPPTPPVTRCRPRCTSCR